MSARSPARQAVPQALAGLALDYLAEARAAASRMRDPQDDEALHDLRVALRRLHSLLRSYRQELAVLPQKQRRRVRRLARASNPARDAEVQLEWLQKQERRLTEEQRLGFQWLQQRLQPPADNDLLRTLRDGVARLHRKLRPALKQLAGSDDDAMLFAELAAARARPMQAEVLAAMGNIGGADDVGAAHEARIAVKRLRYLLTPLKGEGPGCERALAVLRRLQDLLGDLHDRHVLTQLLSDGVAALMADHARDVFAKAVRREGRVTAGDWQVPQLHGLLAVARRNDAEVRRLYEQLQQEYLSQLEPTVAQPLHSAIAELDKLL